MRSILLIILICFVTILNTSGQKNVLFLKAKTTGIERTINEGTRISISCNDGRKFKGKLKIITNSEIMLGSDKISIEEIELLKCGTVFSKITSSILIVGGGLLISIGSAVIVSSSKDNTGNFNSLAVVGLFGAGVGFMTTGIVYFINGKHYKKDIWEFRIITK